MTESAKPHGLLFWIAAIAGAVVVLFVGSAIVAGIIESIGRHSTTERTTGRFPPGVVGVQHIDAGTDYVFKEELSQIGGACAGWHTVSIGRRGHSANDITNIMCWREVDGNVHVATEKEETTLVQPMTNITNPD